MRLIFSKESEEVAPCANAGRAQPATNAGDVESLNLFRNGRDISAETAEITLDGVGNTMGHGEDRHSAEVVDCRASGTGEVLAGGVAPAKHNIHVRVNEACPVTVQGIKVAGADTLRALLCAPVGRR